MLSDRITMIKVYDELQKNKEFQDWRKEHKDSFLTHILNIDQGDDYQLGYADKKGEQITSFLIKNDSISIEESEEIFKDPDTKLLGLDISKVKMSFDQALAKASAFQQEKYSKHGVKNKIVILQHLSVGQVYNITFVTDTFHTINLKLDASTGEIVEESLTSLFDMMREYKHDSKVDYIG